MVVGKGISMMMFLILTVLGSEIVFLQALNPAGGLALEVRKIH
jgi:hypothetical protein